MTWAIPFTFGPGKTPAAHGVMVVVVTQAGGWARRAPHQLLRVRWSPVPLTLGPPSACGGGLRGGHGERAFPALLGGGQGERPRKDVGRPEWSSLPPNLPYGRA